MIELKRINAAYKGGTVIKAVVKFSRPTYWLDGLDFPRFVPKGWPACASWKEITRAEWHKLHGITH